MASKVKLKDGFLSPDGSFLTADNKPLAEDHSNMLTVRQAIIMALTSEFEEDQKAPDQIQEKLTRHNTYEKLLATTKDTEELILQDDEANRLKVRVARQFAMLVAGPLIKMLGTVA